jgi:pimeloyl-ACP methyl ester carboxylesterase
MGNYGHFSGATIMTGTGQFAQLDDIQLHYKIQGHGEPLLMLMGFCGNMNWWPQPVQDYLSARYQLILVDNRGTGLSERGTRKYTMATLADDMERLVNHLGMPEVHVLGVSMGGMIAQEFAIRHPKRVSRIILANTQGMVRIHRSLTLPHLKLGWRYLTDARWRENPLLLNLIFTESFRQQCKLEEWDMIYQAYAQSISWSRAQEQLRAIIPWRSVRRLQKLKAPTLVLAASRDLLIPPRNSFDLARKIPNARFVCLEDQGHGMLYEAFDQIIPHIDEFMASGS